jgi:hypothetical protein
MEPCNTMCHYHYNGDGTNWYGAPLMLIISLGILDSVTFVVKLRKVKGVRRLCLIPHGCGGHQQQ